VKLQKTDCNDGSAPDQAKGIALSRTHSGSNTSETSWNVAKMPETKLQNVRQR